MTQKELCELTKDLIGHLPKSVKVAVSDPGAFDEPVVTICHENEKWFEIDYVPTRKLDIAKCREAILGSRVVKKARTTQKS
jgi:hypothetical protein